MDDPKQILIVEDEGVTALGIKTVLKTMGYSVVDIVATGEAAIKKAGESKPDLILMDIKLAGEMDGITASEKINEKWDVPIVYLTAFSNEEILERTKATNAYGFMVKPFENTELRATVDNAIFRHEMEKKLKESEEKFRSFMNSSTIGFVLCDSDFNLSLINDTGLKIFPEGTKKEDVIGKNILEISPGLEKTGQYDTFLKVLETGEPFSTDDLIPEPKFGDVTLSVRAFKVGDGLGISFEDITERKRAEEKLRENEEKYRTLFEHMIDGLPFTRLLLMKMVIQLIMFSSRPMMLLRDLLV